MVRLLIRQHIFDPIIINWALFSFIFVTYTIAFGQFEPSDGGSFSIVLSQNLDIKDNSLILQYQVLVFFICMVSFPKYFIDSIDKPRISIILTKEISRLGFILKTILSYLSISLFYSILSALFFVILFIMNGILPNGFLISVLLTPLFVLPITIYVIFFGVVSNSYGITVFFTFLFGLILSPIFYLNAEFIFNNESSFSIISFFSTFSLIARHSLPDVYGIMNSLANLAIKGTFELNVLLKMIFSCIPLGLLSFYIFLRKDF